MINDFLNWHTVNDTIMGGNSSSRCMPTSEGLLLKGYLVEEGGGFISCRSPVFEPSINLSKYKGVQIQLDGDGRIFKFAIACKEKILGIETPFFAGLRWVAQIPTDKQCTTTIRIPFSDLEPTVRAQSISLPVRFDPSSITQFQLLHSKFGRPGQLNSGFKSGEIQVLLRSINGYL